MKLRSVREVNTDDERVKIIADLIEEGSAQPEIVSLSRQILKSKRIPEKDTRAEIKAIFGWVKDNIRYTGDITGRDTYFTAQRILQTGTGDCDDFCIITGSLLASVGIPVGCRIISMDKNIGYHHIYALAGIQHGYSVLGGKNAGNVTWLALDGTNKGYGVNDEPNWAKKQDYMFEFD